jgi:hypothetical protein
VDVDEALLRLRLDEKCSEPVPALSAGSAVLALVI